MLPRRRHGSRLPLRSPSSCTTLVVLVLYNNCHFVPLLSSYTRRASVHCCTAYSATMMQPSPRESSLSTRRFILGTISHVFLSSVPSIGLRSAHAAVPALTQPTDVDLSKLLRPATDEQPQIPLPSRTTPFDSASTPNSKRSSPVIAEGTKFGIPVFDRSIL
jgi:hypothetical protein